MIHITIRIKESVPDHDPDPARTDIVNTHRTDALQKSFSTSIMLAFGGDLCSLSTSGLSCNQTQWKSDFSHDSSIFWCTPEDIRLTWRSSKSLHTPSMTTKHVQHLVWRNVVHTDFTISCWTCQNVVSRLRQKLQHIAYTLWCEARTRFTAYNLSLSNFHYLISSWQDYRIRTPPVLASVLLIQWIQVLFRYSSLS